MVFCVNPTNVHGNHGYMKKASVSHQGGRKEGGIGSTDSAPHTLTLFKTKIADFPTLFKTEFRFLIPCLRHLTRNKKKKKKICCSLLRRTYAQAVYRPRKDTLFKTKIDKIDTLFKTKNDKIYTLFKTKLPKNKPWLASRAH